MTTCHIFPSFHYDVAYRDTFKGYLPRSFAAIDAGLDLLEKHKDFVFNIEQVVLVEAYWKAHPSRRPALKRFAAQGRLTFAPGMYTMPDSNIPSGESFIRNALLRSQWLRRHLGVVPDCCWMADVFGHNPQSPQLARTCGFQSYMFERGKTGSWNTTFIWKGIDGTTIPAQWEIDTYYGINLALRHLRKGAPFSRVIALLREEVVAMLSKHGAGGSHLLSAMGGDFNVPEATSIRAVRRLNREFADVEFRFSTPARYFAALKEQGIGLETERLDLNPLCEGCYSSRIRLKQFNRALEERAASLELLETVRATPHTASERLWRTLCWNAFHDIVCGTLEHRAYVQALRAYARSRGVFPEDPARPDGRDPSRCAEGNRPRHDPVQQPAVCPNGSRGNRGKSPCPYVCSGVHSGDRVSFSAPIVQGVPSGIRAGRKRRRRTGKQPLARQKLGRMDALPACTTRITARNWPGTDRG